jgi:hypothetical protein
MENELQILKKKHGSWKNVANGLGITYRTICYIRSGSKQPSAALQKLIELSANHVKSEGVERKQDGFKN